MKRILMMGLTPPLEGGSERHIYEVSSRIENCTVATQRGSNCKKIIGLPIIRKWQYLKSLSFLISSFILSLFLVLTPKRKYDVIHIHENLLYVLVPFLKMRYNVVVTVHGIKGFKFYDNKKYWKLFGYFLSKADKLIAVNLEDKKILEKEFSVVVYVPNGVDLSLYGEINSKVEQKIVFIGRVHEQKGIVYLLEAFELIKIKYPKLKLEIIGKVDDYGLRLQKEFPDKRIIWRGFILNRKEIIKSLKSAACIVLPSLWEGLPLTLFEALASDRPVVVSDIAAFKSVIKKGEAEFSKLKNPKDISEKISKLIVNRDYANKLGKKGGELAQDYSWDKIAVQLTNEYEIK